MTIPVLSIEGYVFKLTCFACPQQFDVYDQLGQMVAYLRLRHGTFRVTCPDYGGQVVYEVQTKGDGIFEKEEELPQLKKAVEKIQEWILDQQHKLAFN